jgi:hypothetical protein
MCVGSIQEFERINYKFYVSILLRGKCLAYLLVLSPVWLEPIKTHTYVYISVLYGNLYCIFIIISVNDRLKQWMCNE